MTDIPLALAPLSLWRPSHGVLVRAAAAAGFRGVGLRLALPDGGVAEECSDAGARRSLRNLLDDEGVGVLDISALEVGPDVDFDAARLVLETGAELGARYLLVSDWDPEPDRAADHLGELCRIAASVGGAAAGGGALGGRAAGGAAGDGITVALEFMPYTAARSLAAARALLSDVAPEHAGIVFDVLHFVRSGGTLAELATVTAGELAYAQLCDAPADPPPPDRLRAEALGARLPPGEGDLPLADIVRALDPLPPVSVEVPCQALAHLDATEQARYLHDTTSRFLAGLALT